MLKNLKIKFRLLIGILLLLFQVNSSFGQSFTESFDDISTLAGNGWVIQNNSSPVGSLSWFQGTATTATPTPGPFNSYNGAANAYISANFNSTGSTGTISNWLITPNRTLRNGDVFTFYTRKPTIGGGQTDYPDRLEVRMSTNGASTNAGANAAQTGDFSTLLLSVNPTLVANVYPQVWTQYTITISGLPAPTSGRIAFRYFVTGAGSLGTNSDYIGIDQVDYTPYVCPTLTLSPATTALPNAYYGTAYTGVNFSQTGALGAPTYTITAGSLPSGLTLSASGSLSGTPTVSGTFNFTVTVNDNSGCSTSRAYTMEVFAIQTVNLSALSGKKYGDSDFDLPATSSAGLVLSYSSDNPNVATISGNTVSIKAAGSTKITVTQAGDATYLPLNKEETFTVGKAILTVTPVNKEKTYDGLIYSDGYDFSYSGFVLGEDINDAAITGNISFTGTSQNATAAGNYPISVDISALSAANYEIQAGTSAQLTIKKRDINGSFVAEDKTYDGNRDAIITSRTVIPLTADNGKLSLTGGTALFDNAKAGTAITVKATGMVLSGDAAANYNLVSVADATANITARPLLVTATGINKVYDGIPVAEVSLSIDKLGADDVIASYTAAAFNNKNVGDAKTVNVSGITIAGDDAANYTVASTAISSANITPKALTVNATGIQKTYDGTNEATVNLDTDKLTADDVTAAYTNAVFDNKKIGVNKPVNVSGITLSGDDAGNYTYNITANTTAEITARTLMVTATGNSKIYNGNSIATVNLSTNKLTADDVIAVYTNAVFDNKNAGIDKAVTVNGISIVGNDATNYTANTTASAVANITAKTLTVTATGNNKIYDGTTVATVNLNTDKLAADNLTVNYTTATFNNKNVGTGKTVSVSGISISGDDAINYVPNTTTVTTAAITVKSLTIIADNKEKFEGENNPGLTASYNGFVPGEDKTVLTVQPNLSTTATANSLMGSYIISVSGASAQNYSISYQSGILTVKPGAPTSVSLSSTILYENQATGTVAGVLSSTSHSSTAVFTYSLVPGQGDTDNSRFTINGNQLQTAQPLDYEGKQSYSVRVRSITQYGFWLDETFTIAIHDVNEAPTIDAIGNQIICYTTVEQQVSLTGVTAGPEIGQTLTITASSDSPTLLSNLTVNNNQLRYRVTEGQSGMATITVKVKDNGGTANGGVDETVRTFTITVNPLPVNTIVSDKGTSISKGETAVLTVSSNNGTSYSWTTANGIISGQNSTVLTVRPMETTTYTVTVRNANGCESISTITLGVKEDYMAVQAENFLTPNGDGVNDNWVIKNIDAYPNHTLSIYDRSGKELYKVRNYQNDWNGTFNGMPLAEGTYYYIIRFDQNQPSLKMAKGFITIVRSK
ncbi:Ig family protein [Pseudopedobacter saltans DSM 12145]|uniref:Ig family protein n=1 Tax=Pseudopedobacter saltans (strain ATCC 51119 / DSM 12145 / JCM 21818 / CCUG 39354 / LMG 10337 / NBRC 100064 / NCIMB 13643) TaxID=762903 RepID=F0SE31_PSESL|nr:YDG domain-containing protein [Pseudopedobacter saltans]ADY52957.1 Ig family protein [Pseudopedobacter saltans DSM 12145]